jgi:hypothetical protein
VNIATALRTAAEAVLRSDAATVTAFSPSNVRLYPLAPPMPPTFPYGLMLTDVAGDDTECGQGSEVTLTLELFARADTYAESAAQVEAIAAAARRALTAPLALTGHVVDDWDFQFDRAVSDPDVLTAHRSVAITYLTSASA